MCNKPTSVQLNVFIHLIHVWIAARLRNFSADGVTQPRVRRGGEKVLLILKGRVVLGPVVEAIDAAAFKLENKKL
jgi:hypothetical protein